MLRALIRRSWRIAAGCCLSLGVTLAATAPAPANLALTPSALPMVMSVKEVTRLSSQKPDVAYVVRLEGDVWWSNPGQGRLVLRDDSGAEELELESPDPPARAGQRIRIEGIGTIVRTGARYRLGAKGPVVDNNGVHGLVEKSGAVYLSAGRHPIRVEWFNGVEKRGLEVQYQGPGMPRGRIPDSALFRTPAGEGARTALAGLEYQCYEGAWQVLPDFDRLTPVKIGNAANFDLGSATRQENVGLRFTGYLETPRDGVYRFYSTSDDGSQLFVGEPSLRLAVIGQAAWPKPQRIDIGQSLREAERGQWVEAEGKVTLVRKTSDGLHLDLSAGIGRLAVEIADAAGLASTLLLNARVRATGFCQGAYTTEGQEVPGRLLVPGSQQITMLGAPPERGDSAETLPVLTTAREVHRLKREEAQRGYRVRCRGVVTCVLPEHQAFVLQDDTRGLYVVDPSASRSQSPQLGEYLRVEGVTDPSLFAPIVQARQVIGLGAGHLPPPVYPAWDQLMNGSLDAQYAEIQGVVTAAQPEGVTLLTRGGIIRVELRVTGLPPEEFKRYENALVRLRGCLFASWDFSTHQVKVGEIRLYDADLMVDQPAPDDLFSIPRKTAADLLLFDPQAGAFQRVRVAGQIVHVREPEYFMMDGSNGLRFVVTRRTELRAGDEVEVVGFPELGHASPILREAVPRKTGRALLPLPKELRPDDLIHADYDSTRVRVEGVLMSVRKSRTDQVLEMQNGVRTFVARLPATEESPGWPRPGSRLEVVGVYAAQGGNRISGQDIATFELLLNSAADVQVLVRPPWWTLRRMLVIVGVLGCVLAFTVLWITQLHRQVEERTAQLAAQIQQRQLLEHQRAMEQERARVAQNLHDELGMGLTEIGLLGSLASQAATPPDKRVACLGQMTEKSRQLVTALDEIVWAVNPRHNSVDSVGTYFSLCAQRFLELTGIPCQLDVAEDLPNQPIDSGQRHELLLAFKEALNNVALHSGATEVQLQIGVQDHALIVVVADNGRGLGSAAPVPGMDGLDNMRRRLKTLGGRCDISSPEGQGTIVRFSLPLGGPPP